MYLARIDAYEEKGPKINCIVSLNPNAKRQARDLDKERATSGPRSLLQGIPVVLKDNIDTSDMPTTGGSFVLFGARLAAGHDSRRASSCGGAAFSAGSRGPADGDRRIEIKIKYAGL